ncbi:MAG: hypothetical protein LBB09_00695, partial [Rickettsiales bacterium]|nr:hypothetical protein [Rickettsiales bacterium]
MEKNKFSKQKTSGQKGFRDELLENNDIGDVEFFVMMSQGLQDETKRKDSSCFPSKNDYSNKKRTEPPNEHINLALIDKRIKEYNKSREKNQKKMPSLFDGNRRAGDNRGEREKVKEIFGTLGNYAREDEDFCDKIFAPYNGLEQRDIRDGITHVPYLGGNGRAGAGMVIH